MFVSIYTRERIMSITNRCEVNCFPLLRLKHLRKNVSYIRSSLLIHLKVLKRNFSALLKNLRNSDLFRTLKHNFFDFLIPDCGKRVNGHLDIWLVKTDINGIMQWDQTYGRLGNYWPFVLLQT